MSLKVVVKMYRKDKGWFSSWENGLIQQILKPMQTLCDPLSQFTQKSDWKVSNMNSFSSYHELG